MLIRVIIIEVFFMSKGEDFFGNYEMLKWAREFSGFPIEEVEKKNNFKKIKLWESGEKTPTLNQAQGLANLYKIPFTYFYLEKPPKIETPKIKFRSSKKVTYKDDIFLKKIIRDVYEKRKIFIDILSNYYSLNKTFKLKRINQNDNVESISNQLRQELNISLEDIKGEDNNKSSLFRYYKVKLENAGILVFQTSFTDTSLFKGFSLSYYPYPIIVINRSDSSYNSKIFTMFHELAHVLMENSSLCDLDFRDETKFDSVEIFCNKVAGETLVPTDEFTNFIEDLKYDSNYDLINKLEKEFKVSKYIIIRRLLDNNYIDKNEYTYFIESIYKNYPKKPIKKDNDDYHSIPKKYDVPSLNGFLFTNTILSAYYDSYISPVEASKILNSKIDHFDDIYNYSTIAGGR
jgi:Zn-dependent peptidase ImmA (M78 family)